MWKKRDEIKQKINKKNGNENIKTPIDDENYIPDFSYMLKTTIKIFFALIVLYVAYIFYKLFGETILTLFNLMIYPFHLIYNNLILFWISRDGSIKIAENNYDIIKNKYYIISKNIIKAKKLS